MGEWVTLRTREDWDTLAEQLGEPCEVDGCDEAAMVLEYRENDDGRIVCEEHSSLGQENARLRTRLSDLVAAAERILAWYPLEAFSAESSDTGVRDIVALQAAVQQAQAPVGPREATSV